MNIDVYNIHSPNLLLKKGVQLEQKAENRSYQNLPVYRQCIHSSLFVDLLSPISCGWTWQHADHAAPSSQCYGLGSQTSHQWSIFSLLMQLHGHTSKPGALFAVRVQHTDDSDRGQNVETADQESQKKMLWQKHKTLSAFMTPDVVAATCRHNGSVTFWRSCMNLNLSCEQYNMLCGACQNLFANWKA